MAEDYKQLIKKQILGQGLSSKWSGQGLGSAEANAEDMARILSGIGITDIKQLGKVPTYEEAVAKKSYNGQIAQQDEDGNYFISVNSGFDNEGSPINSRQDVDPKDLQTIYGSYQSASINPDDGVEFVPADKSKVVTKDGVTMVQTGENFGNKLTGQAVPNTYTERQTGDFFGGTYEGKGNTGYGVKFDAQGNPIFYTQGASSSDMGKIAPFLTLASFVPGLAPFAQGINALVAAKQGNVLGAIAGAAGLGNMAGIGGMADIANAAKYANVLKSGDPLAILMAGANASGVTDVGGFDLKDISKGIGAVKAIESGDPLAMLRYGMSAIPKSDNLTASLGPGDMDEFRANLIPGMFKPGSGGYSPSSEGSGEFNFSSPDDDFPSTFPSGGTDSSPGYYNEITGEFVSDPLGGIQGPLGPETGNFDPNKEWEYSLTRPGVWTSKDGEEIDVSYMPDRDTAISGGELMKRAGAMPGGAKKPEPAKPGAKPAAPGARPTTPGTNPAVDAISNLANQQQQQQNSLLNMMMSDKTEGAKIKSYKDLFGEDLFGGSYVPPSALGASDGFSGMPMQGMQGMQQEQDFGDDGFSNGGRVNNIDVDTLLQILRS
jgi:hypothetical protein